MQIFLHHIQNFTKKYIKLKTLIISKKQLLKQETAIFYIPWLK